MYLQRSIGEHPIPFESLQFCRKFAVALTYINAKNTSQVEFIDVKCELLNSSGHQ